MMNLNVKHVDTTNEYQTVAQVRVISSLTMVTSSVTMVTSSVTMVTSSVTIVCN